MASTSTLSFLLILPLFFFFFSICTLQVMVVGAQMVEESSALAMVDTMYSSYPTYNPFGRSELEEEEEEDIHESFGDGDDLTTTTTTKDSRRSLFWRRAHYYISYGALSANRIPCPPRSGRSYYTHNCYRARGPVRPYSRGCSAITRCRR